MYRKSSYLTSLDAPWGDDDSMWAGLFGDQSPQEFARILRDEGTFLAQGALDYAKFVASTSCPHPGYYTLDRYDEGVEWFRDSDGVWTSRPIPVHAITTADTQALAEWIEEYVDAAADIIE